MWLGSLDNELSAKVFIPYERANISEVLGRVVGVLQIQDIKINETNTDDIVREIYKSGSAEVKRLDTPQRGSHDPCIELI